MYIIQRTIFEVFSFTNSKDIIGGKIKKTGNVTLTTPISRQSLIPRLAHDIFYPHTKFRDYRFSHSGDVIAGIEAENGLRP